MAEKLARSKENTFQAMVALGEITTVLKPLFEDC